MSDGNTATPPTDMQRSNAAAVGRAHRCRRPPARGRPGRAARSTNAKPASRTSAGHRGRLLGADLEREQRRPTAPRATAATRRRITSTPSAPPRTARRTAHSARSPAPATAPSRHVGQVGHNRVVPALVEQIGDGRTRPSSPSRSAFSRATAIASGSTSSPTTTRSGRSSASASATAPLPVPTSATRAPDGSSVPTSTRCSVSGRGISTRRSTPRSNRRNSRRPRM